MDEEMNQYTDPSSPFKRGSRRSLDGDESIRSLERDNSFFNEEIPLGHQSMAYVMSIQSDRKSDIYERIMCLEDVRRSSGLRRSNNDLSDVKKMDSQEVRRSGTEKPTYHSCRCEDDCEQIHCPCFSTMNQICMRGICCDQCVRYKTAMLNKKKGCLCKNSKCLKLYCKCFVNDNPCGKQCKCEGCQNNEERYAQKGKAKKNKKKKQKEQEERFNEQYTNRNPNSVTSKLHNLMPQIALEHTCCSCRKTHCLKKYCSCYYIGLKCGKFCTCEKCENVGADYNDQEEDQDRGRYGVYDDKELSESEEENQGKQENRVQDTNIEQYFEDSDREDNIMPKNMEFQEPDFRTMFERMKM